MESVRSYSSTGISLPRKSGGSAPALVVSGPARCLLRITACRLAESPKATLYIKGSGNFVTSVAAPIASGWSEPVPGRDFQPAVDQRLSRRTDKIRLIADLSSWLQRKGLGAKDIDPQILRRYLKDCKEYMHPDRGVSSTVQELLGMLCEEGIARKECSPKTTRRYERAEKGFKNYLAQERGLSARTLANYLPFVHQLLAERFGNGPIEFAKLRATDITGFVQRHARDHSPGRNGPMVAALRAFLRHLRHRGKIKSDLAACVPTIANWSHVTLPKFLPTGQVEQVLKHCDRRHTTGRRDYAILLLLARLGLRAGEVNALTLDDIDWKEGNLRLRGKGGREAELPLPVDVGEAITGYLRNGRPRYASRCLFIRERAPRVGLASRAISNLVKHALVRAAVHSPRQGAHLFRHS